jgi:hypothetical protein
MSWKEPSERHNDAVIEAIQHAAHLIATTITQGFKHMADTEAQAIADLTAAVTAIGDAVATEIAALQAALTAQGTDHSPAIEASVARLNQLASDLKASAATAAPPAPTA